jgi:hypothetical protein
MSHGILGGDAHGADTPDHVGLGAMGLDLITTGDPFDLAGGKVGAGSESRHRVRVSFGSFVSYRQPPTESGRGCAVVRLSPDQRGAIGIGNSSLLIVGNDTIKNYQQFVTISSAIQQSSGKIKGHDKM